MAVPYSLAVTTEIAAGVATPVTPVVGGGAELLLPPPPQPAIAPHSALANNIDANVFMMRLLV